MGLCYETGKGEVLVNFIVIKKRKAICLEILSNTQHIFKSCYFKCNCGIFVPQFYIYIYFLELSSEIDIIIILFLLKKYLKLSEKKAQGIIQADR